MARQILTADETFEVRDSDLGLPDGDPETVYVLRPLLTETHREIVKRHTTQVLNKFTHQREPVVNSEAAVDEIYDYVLVDWRGIVDRTGAPVACTPETKRGLGTAIRTALLERAGMNQIKAPEVVEQESFRGAAPVR